MRDSNNSELGQTVPFVWQDRRMLRLIRGAFEDQNAAASALAIYLSLTASALDAYSQEFQKPIWEIAAAAGVSKRTAGQRLRDLQSIGVIEVRTESRMAPSFYRLLPFKDAPAVNGCRALPREAIVALSGNGCPTREAMVALSGKIASPPLPTSEEELKKEKAHTQQPEPERPSLDEVKTYADRINLAAWKAEDWFNEMEGGGWLDYNHRPIAKWQSVLNRVRVKWEADGRPMSPPSSAPRPGTTAERPKSVNDLRIIKEAKEAQALDLKNRASHDVPGGGMKWTDDNAKARFYELRKEIKELANKIAGSA